MRKKILIPAGIKSTDHAPKVGDLAVVFLPEQNSALVGIFQDFHNINGQYGSLVKINSRIAELCGTSKLFPTANVRFVDKSNLDKKFLKAMELDPELCMDVLRHFGDIS